MKYTLFRLRLRRYSDSATMALMGKCVPTAPSQIALNLWQRLLLLLYTALFGGILPFICWGALGMPGHPHAGPHFVFLSPPQHNPVANIPSNAASATPIINMAMGGDEHAAPTHGQFHVPDCALADYGGLALVGAHMPQHDFSPAGQAYPSLLAVTLMLLIDLALALLALPADRHGFRRWLVAWWPGMVDLRIPTPPPRAELFPI